MTVATAARERFAGRCHCGAIAITFDTTHTAASLPVRACGCRFCISHGAATATDPTGALSLVLDRGAPLVRYRFGERTADFLICGRCGVYCAAVLVTSDGNCGTVNTRTFDRAAELSAPQPVSYDAETAAARTERRRRRWTPTTIVVGGS